MLSNILVVLLVLCTLGISTRSRSLPSGGRLVRRSLVPFITSKEPEANTALSASAEECTKVNIIHGSESEQTSRASSSGNVDKLGSNDLDSSFISASRVQTMDTLPSKQDTREKLEAWEPGTFLPIELSRAMEASNEEARMEHISQALNYINRKLEFGTTPNVLEELRDALLPELYFSDPSELEEWSKIFQEAEGALNQKLTKDPGHFFLAISEGLKQAKQDLKSNVDSSSSSQPRKRVSSELESQDSSSKKKKISPTTSNTEDKITELENQDKPLTSEELLAYAMTRRPTTSVGTPMSLVYNINSTRAIFAEAQLLLWIKMGFEKKLSLEEACQNIASGVKSIYFSSWSVAGPTVKERKAEEVLVRFDRLEEARSDAQHRIKIVFFWFLQEMLIFNEDSKKMMDGTLNLLRQTMRLNDNPIPEANDSLMKGMQQDVRKIVENLQSEAQIRAPLYRKLEEFEQTQREKSKALIAQKSPQAELYSKALQLLLNTYKLQIMKEANDDITASLKIVFDALHTIGPAQKVGELHEMVTSILTSAKSGETSIPTGGTSLLNQVTATFDSVKLRVRRALAVFAYLRNSHS